MPGFKLFLTAVSCAVLWTAAGVAQEPAPAPAPAPETTGVQVGRYPQEVAQKYATPQGLPSNDALSVLVMPDGQVYAGTRRGVAVLAEDKWTAVPESQGYPIPLLAARGDELLAVAEGGLYGVRNGDIAELGYLPSEELNDLAGTGDAAYLGTAKGLYRFGTGRFEPVAELNDRLGDDKAVRQIAVGPDGAVAVAAAGGLYELAAGGEWQELRPRDGERSWAPVDVRGVAYDSEGRLWFASPQGAGMRGPDGWKLYTGREGLPYNDFTVAAAGAKGDVWFGTKIGAIHFDGETWEYREGLRWLPGNEVRDIAVDKTGAAYFATDKGVGVIREQMMTLADKARLFEEAIDKYHRRTPYGYVLGVRLPAPGDTSSWENSDSDNDGLWTSMYGAGECYAYGATKDPYFKERAVKAFRALKFLMDVTQGGNPPAQEGFVARTILPTSGANPNEREYTPEKDRQRQQNEDKLWKVMDPRWPTSADGQWYWKSDTSSDELDGHYFFYATYYDIVCETEEEKAEVREVVRKLTDHLVRNNFQLVDHDGKPTRWAVYDPERFNNDPLWFVERGLNSLSILSYLATAHHMTGDAKYTQAMDKLVDEHGYVINMLVPKYHTGPGSGNQSDDEMAFMSFYNLLKYTPEDSKLHNLGAFSWWTYWQLERPELNPLFNFMYASQVRDQVFESAFSTIRLQPRGEWLEQSIDSLKRYPLDRFNWRHTNHHRIDIVPLPNYMRDMDEIDSDRPFRKGHRMDGTVLPIDERFVGHWNHDPWSLDSGGDGRELADGASFLLPYYMGLYHGFIVE